jgi:uncharacterized protein YcaQ
VGFEGKFVLFVKRLDEGVYDAVIVLSRFQVDFILLFFLVGYRIENLFPEKKKTHGFLIGPFYNMCTIISWLHSPRQP